MKMISWLMDVYSGNPTKWLHNDPDDPQQQITGAFVMVSGQSARDGYVSISTNERALL